MLFLGHLRSAILLIGVVACLWPRSGAGRSPLPQFGYPRVANLFLSPTMSDSQATVLSRFDINFLNLDTPHWSPGVIDTIWAHNPNSLVMAFWATEQVWWTPLPPQQWPLQAAIQESVFANGWLAFEQNGDTLSTWPHGVSINLSTRCPRGPNGLRYCDWLPGFIRDALVDSTTRVYDVDWDGLWMDNIWEGITWATPDSLDLNLDGIGDIPDSANTWWAEGSQAIIEGLRAELGDEFPITTNGTNHAFEANGRGYHVAQGAPLDGSLPYAYPWRDVVRDHWYSYLNTFDDYDTTLIPLNVTMLDWVAGQTSSAFPDTVATYLGHPFQSALRLWLGTTLLGDGFFSLWSAGGSCTWWRWEYDMDLGDPEGEMYTALSCAGDTLYLRDFENGIVVVNPHDDPACYGEELPLILPWDAYIGPAEVGRQYVFGTIDTTTTLPAAGYRDLYLPADLKVAAGSTLTIRPCTKIYAATTDSCNISGGDSTHVEIIVDGYLHLDGTDGHEVFFQSAADSAAEGDWGGIRFGGRSISHADYADIRHGVYGIAVSDTSWVMIRHCTFAQNANSDITIYGSPDSVFVDQCTLTVGGGIGIDVTSAASSLMISGSTITGSSTSTDGIRLYNISGAPILSGNSITGLSNGYGLEMTSGDPVMTGNTFTGNKYGLYLRGGAPDIGVNSGWAANTISGNVRGISTTCGSGTCPACTGFAPRIRNCNITGNTYGVVTEKRGSLVNLGTSGNLGDNNFYYNTSYCVWNRSTCANDAVPAAGNYWGGCDEYDLPIACWLGALTADAYKCHGPDAFHPPMGITELKPFRVLGVVPNPVTRAARIQFEIAGEAARVGVRIFDVTGRLVRTIQEQHVNPGIHELQWDGRTEAGAVAGSGLYFFRVTANNRENETVKVLVLR